jgi:hypothetical protein
LGGPGEALRALGAEIEREWPGEVERVEDHASRFRDALGEAELSLVRVPLPLSRLVELEQSLDAMGTVPGRWYGNGGAVAWFGIEAGRIDDLGGVLEQAALTGMVVRGERRESPVVGRRGSQGIEEEVKRALDPEGRFPEY